MVMITACGYTIGGFYLSNHIDIMPPSSTPLEAKDFINTNLRLLTQSSRYTLMA
jgi:hypothetical protein